MEVNIQEYLNSDLCGSPGIGKWTFKISFIDLQESPGVGKWTLR